MVETYLGLPAPRVLLPWTANVVTFNHSNVFAATSSVGLVVYASGYYSQDGWARLEPHQ